MADEKGFGEVALTLEEALEDTDAIVNQSILQILLVQGLPLEKVSDISWERAVIEHADSLMGYLPYVHDGQVVLLALIKAGLELLSSESPNYEKLILIGQLSTLFKLTIATSSTLYTVSQKKLNRTKKQEKSVKEKLRYAMMDFLLDEIERHYRKHNTSQKVHAYKKNRRQSEKPKRQDLFTKANGRLKELSDGEFEITSVDKWLSRIVNRAIAIYDLKKLSEKL